MTKEEVSILVVDDVNSIRVHVRELLKSFGFKKVTIAQSSQDALTILASEKIDLVLADWHMDGSTTSGLDLLKIVRSIEAYRAIPFVLVTGESTKEYVLQAIQAGVDDYVVKPLTLVQIQSKVYSVLLKKGVLG